MVFVKTKMSLTMLWLDRDVKAIEIKIKVLVTTMSERDGKKK